MLMLDDDHPDVMEFIASKKINKLTGKPELLEHANISVCISDAFMEALSVDGDWQTQWPTTGMITSWYMERDNLKKLLEDPIYRMDGSPVIEREIADLQKKIDAPQVKYHLYKAKEIWDLICERAWDTAEPGVVFMDRYNKVSNTWYFESIRCTNPCGEQGLPAWGVCNLGAINLSNYCGRGPIGSMIFDYDRLKEDVAVAMRFLDNVVDATPYFFDENETAQKRTRRTGLGTMGLADAMVKCGYRYGDVNSLQFIESVYAVIRDSAYETSVGLAKEKGAAGNWNKELYSMGVFIKSLPQRIRKEIDQHGIRNLVILTQAPTGTTSLLAGVSSGIEPIFAFHTEHRTRIGVDVQYHPLFQTWLDQGGKLSEIPSYFVKSSNLNPIDHVMVQATVQEFTDSSISKTVNAPEDYTIEQVDELYRAAYRHGCKGITFYRENSRDAVLTEVKTEEKIETVVAVAGSVPPDYFIEEVTKLVEEALAEPLAAQGITTDKRVGLKTRPKSLSGYTQNIDIPEGKANITINSDEDGPAEVFINVGRAGSDLAAMSEALGRLISLLLRIPSDMSQTERLDNAAQQLRGIGGSRTFGFGPGRVTSLPDGVGRVLDQHVVDYDAIYPAARKQDIAEISISIPVHSIIPNPPVDATEKPKLAYQKGTPGLNMCPECHNNTLRNEEGCRVCHSCGYSEC